VSSERVRARPKRIRPPHPRRKKRNRIDYPIHAVIARPESPYREGAARIFVLPA